MVSRTKRNLVTWIALFAFIFAPFNPTITVAADWLQTFRQPATPVQALATKIDRVQQHLDKYGTVVPKDPDVWGQSRLMTHRVDFETEMKKMLTKFEFRLNAAEFTRDSAFLSQALSLQAAMNGQPIPASVSGSEPAAAATQQTIITNVPTGEQLNTGSANPSNIVPRNAFSTGSRITGDDGMALPVGIEPTIELDQLKRYLDHLNEIRRLNEGDDTADSPGYALHLVRIPVSVLPGKQTHKGHGAEITMSIRPHLGDDLLPNTFREFVINGVKDRVTPQVMTIADRGPISEIRKELDKKYGWTVAEAEETAANSDQQPYKSDFKIYGQRNYVPKSINAGLHYRLMNLMQNPGVSYGNQAVANTEQSPVDDRRMPAGFVSVGSLSRNGRLSIPSTQMLMVDGITLFRVAVDAYDALAVSETVLPSGTDPPAGKRGLHYNDMDAFLQRELEGAYDLLEQEAARILWLEFCNSDLSDAIREVRRGIPSSRQDVLRPENGKKTNTMATQALITEKVMKRRAAFFEAIDALFPEGKDSSTANLAWQIVVESALINEQLVKDMKKLASNKNAWCLNVGSLPFYGPDPPSEARAAFKQYVQCRWPIHVFALDPVTQDQNVASGISRRREMQLMLAVAASQRALTLQSLTQFVRRLEYDLETIDLNRTAVGFAHGSDTFGWRFYPRIQVPPINSNMSAAFRDLIVGGPNRDDDINQRRLEPGIRECTAIVVMPSFVPNIVLDTQTSWFKLADHHGWVPPRFMRRKGDLRNAVDLSAEVVSLRRLASTCFADECNYRDGELYRLKRAVDTLDRALPLQTTYVEMPYKNVLGGAELFNTGVMGLKPALRDWYGAPGIVVSDRGDPGGVLQRRVSELYEKHKELKADRFTRVLAKADDPLIATLDKQIIAVANAEAEALADFKVVRSLPGVKTTVFLVGKSFSVLNTRVVAGGVEIPEQDVRLISRDVIQVSIPSSVSTVQQDDRLYVDVHLATPYGPTPRLRIPVADDALSAVADAKRYAAEAKKYADAAKAAAPPAFSWKSKTVNVNVTYAPAIPSGIPVVSRLRPQALQNAILLNSEEVPFSGPADIQFGFFLKVKYKDQDAVVVMKGQHKWGFAFETNLVTRSPSGAVQYPLTNQLILEIENYLIAAGSGEVEAMEVDGYLRMIDPKTVTHLDGLPIVHLPLLKLKVVKPSAPQTGAVPAVGSPFGHSIPSAGSPSSNRAPVNLQLSPVQP